MGKDTNAMPKLRRSICEKRDKNRLFIRKALYTLKNAMMTNAKTSVRANAYGVRHAHAVTFSHKHNDNRCPVAGVITASYDWQLVWIGGGGTDAHKPNDVKAWPTGTAIEP